MRSAEALPGAVPVATEAPSDPIGAAREAIGAALEAAGPRRHVVLAALALRLARQGHVQGISVDIARGPEVFEAVHQALADLAGPAEAPDPDPSRPPGAPWTVGELASACSVSPSYVRKCIRVGTLAVHRVGRVVRIAEPEAHRFAADLGVDPVSLAHHAHHAHAVK